MSKKNEMVSVLHDLKNELGNVFCKYISKLKSIEMDKETTEIAKLYEKSCHMKIALEKFMDIIENPENFEEILTRQEVQEAQPVSFTWEK